MMSSEMFNFITHHFDHEGVDLIQTNYLIWDGLIIVINQAADFYYHYLVRVCLISVYSKVAVFDTKLYCYQILNVYF